ncbi:helix-turn-helix domain-containing protein [Priestia megaterium]|uniref:MerR family transcriptional regulator n=1 Tax=Priestia megaterium TaxID=1404 RepID=UPI002E1C472E|nr:helix-turn-helix domain-containing protein [Priestia megaterium]
MKKRFKLYSIGETSKLKNLSIKALRYYHKEKILIPAYINESTGYRYYSPEQFFHIDIIKTGRQLNVSIEEMQKIFSSGNTEELIYFLEQKKKDIVAQISQLNLAKNKIDILKKKIDKSFNIMNDDDFKVTYFQERYLITTPSTKGTESSDLLDYSTLECLMKNYKIKSIYESGTLYYIDETGRPIPTFVFELINKEDYLKNKDLFSIIPAGNYLTLSYTNKSRTEKMLQLKNFILLKKLYVIHCLELDLFTDIFDVNACSWQLQVYIKEYN